MTYILPNPLAWDAIATPLAHAEDALARLDERMAKSPVREGFVSRGHFADAGAALRLEGELVSLEDLVLHDAGMDRRAPSHELTRAHTILRARRRIAEAKPGWALSEAGLLSLRGQAARGGGSDQADHEELWEPVDDPPLDEPLAAELAALDQALLRTNLALATRDKTRDPLVYDPGFDEDLRIAGWRRIEEETRTLPALLAAALLWEAWVVIEPLEHLAWLGPLLVAATLRARSKTRHHLPQLAAALHLVPPPKRRSPDAPTRLAAFLEAVAAMAQACAKDHDRWLTARRLLERKLEGRRRNSRMGTLIELVIARPIVNAALIARELEITPRAAQTLVGQLGLRELTGRGRYRAWGIL
jgi:Protein of unknown function (DUF1612)/HTH DNA binding domain